MLDKDLYIPVLITYLQDRLLDNFEDEIENTELQERTKLMDQVVELFNPDNENPEVISNNLKNYASLIPDKNLQLLTENSLLLREAFDTLSLDVKKISFKWLNEMNQGMKKYLSKEVTTFSELDEYCYYVAGTVGGFLTELILHIRKVDSNSAKKLLNNYNEAGLFLQKVNLVRDIKEDIRSRKKHFWPLKSLGLDQDSILMPENRKKAMEALNNMVANVKLHIPNLISYFDALPVDLAGYRRFFSVNNSLGLATIEKLENNPAVFYGKKPVKVTKMEFLKIMKDPVKYFYNKAISFEQI